MKTIQAFEDVEFLPIPDDIKAKLLAHLVEPFGDIESTKTFWREVGTTLYLIEPSDTDESLAEETEETQHFIRFITNYPEYVLLLNGEDCPWILAVAIITMEGGGAYLLSPTTSPTLPARELLPQATDNE
ncbi:TPA: hypothetical protein NJ311_003630 [Vibrio parahaemolyticus]|nr:hypothetical protein [Vibrio parahaemolyticus]